MAEADPAVVYAGYGYPYAYGFHSFGGKSAPCVNAANVPVPCAGAPLAYAGYPYGENTSAIRKIEDSKSVFNFTAPVAYGKRSADAEPEADAAYFG